MDVAANFTLILAHLALCLHSFGVRTHLKRTLSSGAWTGGSAGVDEGTDSGLALKMCVLAGFSCC